MFQGHLWLSGLSILVYPVFFSLILGVSSRMPVFRTMADGDGANFKTAAPGAHRSMGGVERQHTRLRTLSEMLLEVYHSMTLSERVALAHMGKNFCFGAKLWYSRHQIMFGVSSWWPDSDDCDLPVLGSYDIAADHVGHYMALCLSQMYQTREVFHAADAKSKMKEAERFQGAPKQNVVFTQGDRVYYYHDQRKQGAVS